MLTAFAGGRLLGARYGDAPAEVVALHGWARAHSDFDAVLDGLDAAAPDLPGFGATAAPPEPWGSPAYAVCVAAMIEELGRPVVVVGHSFGGRVAVVLAATRPDLVSALILTGVPLLRPAGAPAPRAALGFRAAKLAKRVGLVSAAAMEKRRRESGPLDYRNAVGVMRDVFVRVVNETTDGTYTRALAGLACSLDLLWGENDTAAPITVAEEVVRLVPTARLTRLPDVGHLTPIEAPAALRSIIDRCR